MQLKKRHILSILENKTEDFGDRVALGMRSVYGWREFTYKGVSLLSRKLATYMINELQVEKGDKVAILSESKPEYGVCVFASILAGTVSVPLDIKLTIYELKSILLDSAPTVVLVSQTYLDKALQLKEEVSSIKHILVLDENSENEGLKNIYELPDKYDAKWRVRGPKATAFIIYTSGTTGAPKGVEICFKNITSQLVDIKDAFDKILPRKNIAILSILPMNHLFEMTVGFSSFLNYGYSVYYTKSLKPNDIMKMIRDRQIEFMIVVPAFLKLMKTTIEADVMKKYSFFKKRWFEFKYFLAKFIPFYCVKKLMFRDIHKQFGGKFIGCLSGGAPLDIHVGKFFNRIGIMVFQGYGLSETSPVVSFNNDNVRDLVSVGKPLKSWQAKVDPTNGELLLKGPAVMKGYHNQPELTSQVLEKNGWLHTGDVAKIGKNGHLYITGRIKNMIVLSGGKKVLPEEVESVLEKSEYLAEVCVFGASRTFGAKDGTEEVVAVVVPKDYLYNEQSEEEIEKLVRADIKNLLQRLTPYKRPVNIIVRREALPRTATRKIKRKEVKALVSV